MLADIAGSGEVGAQRAMNNKTEAIDAILQSAVRAFAASGYEGASLRDIAAVARVPHSTINHYYGSKHDLFYAAIRWAWENVDLERQQLLDQAIFRGAEGEPAPLNDLLYALAYPIVRRSLSGDELAEAELTLLTQHLTEVIGLDSLHARVDRTVEPWISSIRDRWPTIPHDEIVWAFSYCIGVIYSWQLTSRRYDSLLNSDVKRSVDEVTAEVVTFAMGGVEHLMRTKCAKMSGQTVQE